MRRSMFISLLASAALTGTPAPAAAQATIVDIGVCVVVQNELREVRAEYNTATGDTTVNGRPFSRAYPTTRPPYAATAPWYINNEAFNSSGERYEKFGLPRVLGVGEVARVGSMGDHVPIFAEIGGSLASEVLYVPVRIGCEFQPYRREAPAQTPAPARVPPAPVPVRVVETAEMRVGSTPNDVIGLQEIRFTSRSTEILLRFYSSGQPYTGHLHAPGADLAMYLRDQRGNEYELSRQEGWPGNGRDGFGSATIPAGTERLVILYFEPVRDPAAVDRLDLVEGDCEDGCWHFYDIRLQDR